MPTELTPLLVVLPALLVLSGFFSGAETAIFGLRWEDRARLRRSSARVSRQLTALLHRPRRLLIGVLLGEK